MYSEPISARAILPKKNPHPHKEPAIAQAANPSARFFSEAILLLSHIRKKQRRNTGILRLAALAQDDDLRVFVARVFVVRYQMVVRAMPATMSPAQRPDQRPTAP